MERRSNARLTASSVKQSETAYKPRRPVKEYSFGQHFQSIAPRLLTEDTRQERANDTAQELNDDDEQAADEGEDTGEDRVDTEEDLDESDVDGRDEGELPMMCVSANLTRTKEVDSPTRACCELG